MAKPSLCPGDPFAKVGSEIADYISGRCGDDVARVVCKPNVGGLFVGVIGESDHNFFLSDLEERIFSETGPLSESALTLTQLLALNLPPPTPLIHGFLNEGETVVLAGRQKVGKSRLVQQMALCLSAGEPFLGMAVPQAKRVLMIDLENRLAPLKQRFRAMRCKPSDKLHLWCAESLASVLPDATAEGAVRLRELVDAAQPDVLIIDPWRLWLGGDENDAREVVRGLKVLAGLRRANPKLAIVIVHHVRKEKFDSPKRLLQDPSLWADAVSGHHALMSHVDACFGLERQTDEDDFLIVFGGIARNTEPQTLILEEDESLLFSVSANEDSALKVMTNAQRKIWQSISGLRSFGFTKALTAAGTKNRKALTATLQIAVHNGLLTKDGDAYIRVVQ